MAPRATAAAMPPTQSRQIQHSRNGRWSERKTGVPKAAGRSRSARNLIELECCSKKCSVSGLRCASRICQGWAGWGRVWGAGRCVCGHRSRIRLGWVGWGRVLDGSPRLRGHRSSFLRIYPLAMSHSISATPKTSRSIITNPVLKLLRVVLRTIRFVWPLSLRCSASSRCNSASWSALFSFKIRADDHSAIDREADFCWSPDRNRDDGDAENCSADQHSSCEAGVSQDRRAGSDCGKACDKPSSKQGN